MTQDKEISIRRAKVSDIENLKQFFIKAYGEKTIFQNEIFLLYYFDTRNKERAPFSLNLLGLSPEDEIVSHYGGLLYNLRINNDIHPMIWGVSAFTIPAWRGKGINSKIVDFLIDNNEINGVIGFTRKTASFYQNRGYNIFNFDRFTRYFYILDIDKTLKVIDFIKQNTKKIKEVTQIHNKRIINSYLGKVIELTNENICNYEMNLEETLTGVTTTNRSKDFLIWRFFKNPTIKYSVYGFVKEGAVQTYMALREEILEPLNYRVNRIIDLYGNKDGINPLLEKSINESVSKNHIYIDFSMYGTLYENELNSSPFSKLENDDCCILPQVTSPIEDRVNAEFLGIQSKYLNKAINGLSKENVYFTRIDSDRDRSARIS